MANPNGNPQNLNPVTTEEEARKKGRAGGIASARARQERKSMRETMEILLKMPMKNGRIDSINGIESLSAIAKDQGADVNLTLQDMMLVATVRKAMKGDIRAVEYIQSLLGEQAVTTASPLDALAEELREYEDDRGTAHQDPPVRRPREPAQDPQEPRQHGLPQRMGGRRP